MNTYGRYRRWIVLLLVLAVMCCGCQDEEKETSPAVTEEVGSVDGETGISGGGWTSGPAGKNGATDDISVLWYLTLENVFSDYEGFPEYHISACIDEFISDTDIEANVDLYYNWNIMKTRSVFSREEGTQIKWNAEKQSTQDYFASEYAKSLTAGAYLMEGTVSKSWTDDYEELMDRASKQTKLAILNQSLMGILGDLYEAKTGGIEGLLDAELYLTDLTFYAARVEGTLWVCFAGEDPVCLTFMCHQASRSLADGVVYRYRIDESAEYSAEAVGKAMFKLDVALTTAKTENVEIPVVSVMAEEVQSREPYVTTDRSLDIDGDGLTEKTTSEMTNYGNGSKYYVEFGNGDKVLVGDIDYYVNRRGVTGIDVTGDGVSEMVFCVANDVLSGRISTYYGIWQLEDGEWTRLKMAEETAEDTAAMVVQMTDIPLKVERVSDTELKITSLDAQVSETITMDADLIDQFWPAADGQAVYPVLRSKNTFWEGEYFSGDYCFYGKFRIGAAEIIGKLQYREGYWAMADCEVRLAEKYNDAEAYEELGALHKEQWLVILEEALIRFDGTLEPNTLGKVKKTYDAIFCLPWVFREGLEEVEIDAFFWVSDSYRFSFPDWYRGRFTDSGEVLAWNRNYVGWQASGHKSHEGSVAESSLVIDSASEVEFIGSPLDPESENYADQCAVVELLLGAALRYAGEVHLEKYNSIEETMKVWIYILESTYDLDDPRGTLLIQFGENEIPTKIDVAYEGSCRDQVTGYQLTVDENAMPFYSVENAICLRSVITTTDNRQNGIFSEADADFTGEDLLDKVLRVMNGTEEQVILFLTNGKTVELAENWNAADTNDRILCLDLTGDGVEEVLYLLELNDEMSQFRIFEKVEDGLQEMQFVTEFGELPLGMVSGVYIPVTVEKTDDLQLKVTQAECGKSVILQVDEQLLEWIGLSGDQYGPYDSYADNRRVELDIDPDSGKSILRMSGSVAGRIVPVTWEMMFEDGVWKITDFYGSEQ